jgi:hypothetical protein
MTDSPSARYDPEYDRQRKAKLAAYYGRSTKQEAIDDRVIEEAKAIQNSVRAAALRSVARECAARWRDAVGPCSASAGSGRAGTPGCGRQGETDTGFRGFT